MGGVFDTLAIAFLLKMTLGSYWALRRAPGSLWRRCLLDIHPCLHVEDHSPGVPACHPTSRNSYHWQSGGVAASEKDNGEGQVNRNIWKVWNADCEQEIFIQHQHRISKMLFLLDRHTFIYYRPIPKYCSISNVLETTQD